MNVASLELCKELYELSGWKLENWWWSQAKQFADTLKPGAVSSNLSDDPYLDKKICPAYDLGYLLRKLPAKHYNMTKVVDSPEYISYVYKKGAIQWECGGDTPEDCLAELAIELFKQGILKPELEEK